MAEPEWSIEAAFYQPPAVLAQHQRIVQSVCADGPQRQDREANLPQPPSLAAIADRDAPARQGVTGPQCDGDLDIECVGCVGQVDAAPDESQDAVVLVALRVDAGFGRIGDVDSALAFGRPVVGPQHELPERLRPVDEVAGQAVLLMPNRAKLTELPGPTRCPR